MKQFFKSIGAVSVFALLLAHAVTEAQVPAPVRGGPLEIQNNLSEIQRNGTDAQAAARSNLGITGSGGGGSDAASLVGPGLSIYQSTALTTINPLVVVASTTYTITTANAAQEINFNSAAPVAVTLPAASTVGFTAGFAFGVQNEGAGDVTITPVSGTIGGLSSLRVVQQSGCEINSDGANWRLGPSCTAILPGAFGPNAGITQLTGDILAGPGAGLQAATVHSIGGVIPGTIVGANAGASGHAVGLLDQAKVDSGANTYSAVQTFQSGISINTGFPTTPAIFATGATGTGLRFSNSFIGFPVGGVDRACAQSNSFVAGICGSLIATNGGFFPPLEAVNNTNHTESNAVASVAFPGTTSAQGAGFICARAASAVIGTLTAVQAGNLLCHQYMEGTDGTAFFIAADVETDVDAAVTAGAIPGRMITKTANSVGVLVEASRVDSRQHQSYNTGNLPVVSSCGAGSAIEAHSSDTSGMVTVGTSAASCTVTFALAFLTYNHCRVTPHSTTAAFGYTYTKSAIVVSATVLDSIVFDWNCDGQ